MDIKRIIATIVVLLGTLLFIVEFLPSAHVAQTHTGSKTVAAVKIPPFVDDIEQHGVNAPPTEILQRNVWQNNREALQETFELDRDAVRLEMARRVQDQNYPRRLRSLAAAVLLARNEDVGREYFRQQLDPLTVESVDALWLMGYVGVYGGTREAEYPDMTWAEDLMIRALQDKRTLSRDAICRCNYVEDQKLVEIRELAVGMGSFPKILSNLKSKKALPVLIALVEENPPYIARSVIAELGKFEDKGVEPLILQILKTHDDRFYDAVTAAADLKMRSAFSIILEHLDLNDENGGIEYGLNALAHPGDVPVLRTKLKTLKSYRRAEMQLLILKLQPEDPVPELLKLLRDQKFLARSDVIFRLEELKDKRAVKDLINVLCTDTEATMRTFAMRALGTIRTPDAIEGLIMGLEANYKNVVKRKISQSHDYKKEYQQRILEELKEVTGQDFGTNTEEWRKWLTTAYHPRWISH